ncbi:MAG: hypothetical protein OSB43_15575 [Nocardioides sp.]|uniref:hypothetical protein n=1 Tax=Nocardioides sp. TaxID=35761 RepID=UPI0023A24B1B|nr:hypothetical protein [Nocardioides sp.]MDE0777696.1 hypothetical protein [Nocardioides sp.]
MRAALAARSRGAALAVVGVVALLVLAAGVGLFEDSSGPTDPSAGTQGSSPGPAPGSELGEAGESGEDPARRAPNPPPAVGEGIFGRNRTLVAYYGAAGTGALGVLGEGPPNREIGRLEKAARAFERPDRPVQIVYELIVTVADVTPGPDGDYSHDVPRRDVERYLRAARRHDAMLLLDIQPGRASFPEVAQRWEWALKDPRVGLALDPEWRMARGAVPGRVIGSVDAAEVNQTSLWLANLVRRERLPQKLFVLHQFRTSMIERIDRVAVRRRLATVQHVDGFGTEQQKMATYDAVLRPQRFHPGFKLFYDEDIGLMSPARVLKVRPRVRFVSYQ